MDYKTYQQRLEHRIACNWQAASAGQEQPFLKNGKVYLYMWNRISGQHAYYCISDDLFLTDSEALDRF